MLQTTNTQPVATLTAAWLDKMQSYGVNVSTNHGIQAVKIADVLHQYDGKTAHQVAIPAAAGFGKSVMIEEFAKSVAHRPDRPLLVVKLLKEEVSALVDAINEVSPGSAMAVKGLRDCASPAAYRDQFDKARFQNVIVMTHSMFQQSLMSDKHRDMFDRRVAGVGKRGNGGIRRQIIVDEVPNLIIQHEFTLADVDKLIEDLHFVADRMKRKYHSSFVTAAIEQIKEFRDEFGKFEVARHTTPRFGALNPGFFAPTTLNIAVKAMLGYDVLERLTAVESAIRAGLQVSKVHHMVGGNRVPMLTGHVVYSLADLASDLPMICFDFTADVDPRYLDLPGLQQLALNDETDYSNVTIYYSNYNTFSKSHHEKEKSKRQFVQILKDEVWPRLNGEMPVITFHKRFYDEYIELLEEEGLEFESKIADTGRSDNSFSHLSAAVISGPLSMTAGTNTAIVEVLTSESVIDSYKIGVNGIEYDDPRVQSFVDRNAAVYILQTAARIRYAHGKKATVFVFGFPPAVRDIVASKLPGAKFVDLKLKGLRRNKAKKRDTSAEKLDQYLREFSGDEIRTKDLRDAIGVPPSTFRKFRHEAEVVQILKETGWRFATPQRLERVAE